MQKVTSLLITITRILLTGFLWAFTATMLLVAIVFCTLLDTTYVVIVLFATAVLSAIVALLLKRISNMMKTKDVYEAHESTGAALTSTK